VKINIDGNISLRLVILLLLFSTACSFTQPIQSPTKEVDIATATFTRTGDSDTPLPVSSATHTASFSSMPAQTITPNSTQVSAQQATSTHKPFPTYTEIVEEPLGLYIYNISDYYSFHFYGLPFADVGRIELPTGGPTLAALYLEFAPFQNLIAYWTASGPGQLWISDLAVTDSHLIFTDANLEYPLERTEYPNERIKLIWSSNKYLIVEVMDQPDLGLIYHIKEGTLEPFPYICDRVAISPRSELLTEWCVGVGGEEFAVLEWNGEIWFSSQPPMEEFVRRDERGYNNWAWSEYGGRIAFFDPNDPDGLLRIADSRGHLLLEIWPGGAYWKSDLPGNEGRINMVSPPSPSLQWAMNESRILVWGVGNEERPCPEYRSREMVPCWHVIDSYTGEEIWSLSDNLTDVLPLGSEDPERIIPIQFFNPALSPSGRFLALFSFVDTRQFCIIDVDHSVAVHCSNFHADNIHWGPPP
jgi:hypothetical protein